MQSLFALSLGELSSEKLAQRVVTKWKRRLPARNRLRSKHCYNARRDLLNNRRERRDKPMLRGAGFLRCGWKCAEVYVHNRPNQRQHAPPENLSLHKTSLFQKRIACTTAPGPFCEERVSFFEFREGAASFRKNARPFWQPFREAHGRLERVVLNTLAEQMPLCRLIFGPVQCHENFILRLRRLASSSEMPIHLSRGQRARLQPTKDH